MSRKILVTGGAGYIGSLMIPSLLEQGYKVTVIDNFMYGQCSLNHVCNNSNFTIVNGDIRSKSLMKSLAGINIISNKIINIRKEKWPY